MSKKSYYYNIINDFNRFPLATVIVVYGGRSTGKTYSTLNFMREKNKRFVFIKRTIDDVKLLCNGQTYGQKPNEKNKFRIDASPFKPINRDFGTNIKAFQYYNGIGGFYRCDENNDTVGEPIGYLFALSAVSKFKGFDLSECEYIIFDEFCPKPYERVNKKEGEQLLDLIKTIERDRNHRGLPPLKIILLANADNVACPVTQTFNITDTLAKMSMTGQEYFYDDERHLLLHKLIMSDEFIENEKKSDIYTIMKGSEWERMALENEFAFNDFSQVKKQNMHRYSCYARVLYHNEYHYIYINDRGEYYITKSQSKHYTFDFDLSRDQDKYKFVQLARYDIMRRNNVWFETYSLYYLYRNCEKIL